MPNKIGQGAVEVPNCTHRQGTVFTHITLFLIQVRGHKRMRANAVLYTSRFCLHSCFWGTSANRTSGPRQNYKPTAKLLVLAVLGA